MLDYDINTHRWTLQLNETKYRAMEKMAKAQHVSLSSFGREILEAAGSEILKKVDWTPEDEQIVLDRIQHNLDLRNARRANK